MVEAIFNALNGTSKMTSCNETVKYIKVKIINENEDVRISKSMCLCEYMISVRENGNCA